MSIDDIRWRTDQSDPGDEHDYREADTANVDTRCKHCSGEGRVIHFPSLEDVIWDRGMSDIVCPECQGTGKAGARGDPRP